MIIFVKIEELFNKSPRFLSILLSISISFAVTANNSSDSLQNNLDEVIKYFSKSKVKGEIVIMIGKDDDRINF